LICVDAIIAGLEPVCFPVTIDDVDQVTLFLNLGKAIMVQPNQRMRKFLQTMVPQLFSQIIPSTFSYPELARVCEAT